MLCAGDVVFAAHAERFALDVHEPHLVEPARVHTTRALKQIEMGRERGLCPDKMPRADNGRKGEMRTTGFMSSGGMARHDVRHLAVTEFPESKLLSPRRIFLSMA
jgi:hypothetical protein